MKVVLFSLLFLVVVLLGLPAETVMVNLQNDAESGFIVEERVAFASAIEEGAMEPFFDSDHIVFNMGLSFEEDAAPVTDEIASRVALGGGARYLLNLKVGGSESEDLAPGYLIYQFLDLVEKRTILRGTVAADSVVAAGEEKSPMRICFLLGNTAALESIEAWSVEVAGG